MLGKDLSPVAEYIDLVQESGQINQYESGTIG